MKGAGASSRSLMYHVLCFEMKPARLPNRWSPALRSGDSALISSHSPSDYEGLFLADCRRMSVREPGLRNSRLIL
jgi:hypothetical protein